MQGIIPSLYASHFQPPYLANKKGQEPTDLLWLVLFHFELIKMLCLQFIFVGTLLFQRHLNKNYISNGQIKRVAHFILCFEGILCSLIITNYIICAIYFLLIYLLQRMTDLLQLFLFVSAFSFLSTRMTNTATTKLIYQQQVFKTLKDCLCGCLN